MIPVDYPMKPPNIKFDSKFWHPNITIQNEFVNNLKSSWSPKTSIMNVINSLHEFLCEDQPQVDHEFKSSKQAYKLTGKQWVSNYVQEIDISDKILTLGNIGFDQDAVFKISQKTQHKPKNQSQPISKTRHNPISQEVFALIESPIISRMENVREQEDMMIVEYESFNQIGKLFQKESRTNILKFNNHQEQILKNIEKNDQNELSPRSKEVFMISILIKHCFSKYNKPPKTQLELYKIGKVLGKGAFGRVNLGLHRLSRKLCAIKSINIEFFKEENQKTKILSEINILKMLRHPNNIKIFETFQTQDHHMIVMELCPGGDLLNYVRKRRKLSEKQANCIFQQLIRGIAYLHENSVVHRDIKLDNILLDGHGNIKICDFGVSVRVKDQNHILYEQCGTPSYIAPEIIKQSGYRPFPIDIWSAGICLYAMIYGNVPIKAYHLKDLTDENKYYKKYVYETSVSPIAIDLMKRMLNKDPQQRITAQEILKHEWLQEFKNEIVDIFDEQELDLVRKEFTYVIQKRKLQELNQDSSTREALDLNTEFTEHSLKTHQSQELKNDSERSVVLCPFNTLSGDKNNDYIMSQAAGMMEDKDFMIHFHHRCRELDRNYEKQNNLDFDNGVYHKFAYKGRDAETNSPKKKFIKSDQQNYYLKTNHQIIEHTSRLGFPVDYIVKTLNDNACNHCTTTYYLLCMDQNY